MPGGSSGRRQDSRKAAELLAQLSGETAERAAAVVLDHGLDGHWHVDGRARLGAGKLDVGAGEVADDSFGIVPLAKRTEIGLPRRIERAQPCRPGGGSDRL